MHCDRVKTAETAGRVSYARRCGAPPGLNERGLGDWGTGDFRRAVGVLVRSLPAPVDPTRSDGDFGDFIYALYAEYVARHGCTAEDLESRYPRSARSPRGSPPSSRFGPS